MLSAIFSIATQLGATAFRVPMPEDPAVHEATFSASDRLDERLKKIVARKPELARSERKLIVHKAAFTLEAMIGSIVLKRYVVNLGWDPFAPKEKQGDGRTPIGRYFVRDKHDSRFFRFFGLSYPSLSDVDRGLKQGLIDRPTARALSATNVRGQMPDWHSALGGAVGIHGGGAYQRDGTNALLQNWTWGCIALRNQDIADLDGFTREGIAVEILP